jgi:hypothetical protein
MRCSDNPQSLVRIFRANRGIGSWIWGVHPQIAIHPECPLSDGEIWTAHGDVNPCGLVVQQGDWEIRTRWLC